MALREIDVVPAVEQLIAADGIDGEGEAAIAAGDGLLLQIDCDRRFGISRNKGAEFADVGFRQDGRQKAVLDGVLRKDVAE